MARYDLEILIRTRKEGKGVQDAEKDVESFGRRLNSTLKTIEASAAAALAAGVTFQKAFEFSQEGAELIQLEDSFNNLNDTVLQTPDLLEDMRAAARGTIGDTDLMAGVLKLAAGTSGEYAQTLAAVSPQLIEISKASNKLNPLLGDTTFLYESLTTAAKRQSVPIADNLGLIIKMDAAVKQVHPALQTLATDYEDLTEQQKFLNELLFQGDTLINQVGGSVDSMSDPWARLSVQVQTTTESFKRWLAEGLLPTVQTINQDHATAVENIIEKNLAEADSIEDVREQLERLIKTRREAGGIGLFVTGTGEATQKGIEDTIKALARQAKDADELRAILEDIFGPDAIGDVRRYGHTIAENVVVVEGVTLSFDELASTTKESTAAADQHAEQMERVRQAHLRAADGTEEVNTELRNLFHGLEDTNERLEYTRRVVADAGQAVDDYEFGVEELREAEERREKIHEEVAKALIEEAEATKALAAHTGDLAAQALKAEDGLGFFNESLDDIGMHMVRVGGLTAEQSANLDELQEAYKKTEDSIRSLEGGLKGVGLTEEERNEQLTEQHERLEQLTAAMAPLLGIQGDLVSLTGQATLNYGALGDALFAAADAAGADAETLIGLKLAYGELTEAQAEFLLKQVAMQRQAETLGQLLADGNITIEEAKDRMLRFAESLDGTAQSAEAAEAGVRDVENKLLDAKEAAQNYVDGSPYEAEVSIYTAGLDSLHEMIRLLDAVDGRHARATATVNESYTPPADDSPPNKGTGKAFGGPVSGGTVYQVGEFNKPELFMQGGRMFMIPGDDGRVFSNRESQGLLSGGGVTIHAPITIYDASNPQQTVALIRTELEKAGQRLDAARRMR